MVLDDTQNNDVIIQNVSNSKVEINKERENNSES